MDILLNWMFFLFFIPLLLANHTDADKRSSHGYCAPYNGSVCKDVLGSQMVYFNTSFENPAQLHEQIVIDLLIEFDKGVIINRALCREPAKKLLCHYAFPNCDESKTAPLPLCKEDCIAVEVVFCYKEWSVTEVDKKSNKFIKNRAHFRLPVCKTLPTRRSSFPTCSEAGMFERKAEEVTSDCYIGKGRWYNGTVNVTKNGLTCQSWSVDYPHSHRRHPDIFAELENSENYCRNPGGDNDMPWCYVNDTNSRWAACNISKCNSNNVTPNPKHKPDRLSLINIFIITVVVSLGVMVLAVIFILCYQVFFGNHGTKYKSTPQDDLDIDLDRLPQNMSYHRIKGSKKNRRLEAMEYPRNDILYIRDIGQGAFGRVFKAKAANIVKGEELTLVAVKMLKDDASDDLMQDFEREATLMAEFDHQNIVKLLGVCAIGKPMCLLFEYMTKGDLNEFLRLSSPEQFIVYRRPADKSDTDLPNIDHCDLLYLAKQISNGMVYVSGKGYVHRDLATRNCLVGDNLTVKISDFGLARNVHSVNYYKGSEHDAIPIRWMPLETILNNKFTIESDVWSFGVVLWEIFSFALQPYYGMAHEEVVKYVKDGKVLASPDDCPVEIYDLMRMCWSRKHVNRPSFETLNKSLNTLHSRYLLEKRLKEAV
ncbi:muscle, skeletal receptor tyrosine protein kinase-like [Argonauta hians]